jgi:hypothetical protein
MPTITADKAINQLLYTKKMVDGVGSDLKTVVKRWLPNDKIGTIYSYIERPDGLYWMFYDYLNQPFYVKHDADKLRLPAMTEILNDITAEQEKKKLQEKGVLQYNIDKYLPYIIGAGAVAIVLPAIVKAQNKHKVSGMKASKETKVLLAVGAAVAIYFLLKKKRKAGVPLVEDLGGEFVSVVAPGSGQHIETVSVETGGGSTGVTNSGNVRFVGPFEVAYNNGNIAGAKIKGNLGNIKLN